MYAYLTSSVIFGLIWLALFLYRKDLRYEILFVSFLFLPFGFTQPLFVPEYWNPAVIHKFFGLFDVESLLHTFFIGGVAASLYEEIFGYALVPSRRFHPRRAHAYMIYGSLLLSTAVLVFVKLYTSYSVLWAWFIVVTLLAPYFLVTRPDLAKPSALAGVTFMALYVLVLRFVDFAFGGFIVREWNFQGTWGVLVLGIPLEEYIYGFFLGMVFGTVYEEVKNLKLVRGKA
ncbi:MAG: hypothetical protein HYY10_03595 [Candidatus Liptonbacteria bacterium]|nr:hypothetical protein [Candidatus Liptonbacteria bacterium]